MSLPAIYILHGWALGEKTEQKWQPFLDELNQAGYQTQFLQLPGLSCSLKEPWHLSDYRCWLSHQLPQDKKVILLGHSFGGQLAVSFAAKYPQRLEKLILIDSAGVRNKKGWQKLKVSLFKVAAKVGKALFSILSCGSKQLQKKFRKILYILAREKDYYQAPPQLRQTLTNVLQADIQHHLPNIKQPTLLIWGEQDTSTPISHAQIFKQKIKHSQLKTIKQARHSPQYTHPQIVAKMIDQFLSEKSLSKKEAE